MPLIATPGDPAANSYETVDGADAYFEDRKDGEVWIPLDETVKVQSLIRATSMVDILPGAWTGAATNPEQALGWPRTGMKNRNGFLIDSVIIPQTLKSAICELARVVSEEDLTASDDVTNLGISSISAGPVSISFREKKDANGMIVTETPSAELAARLMVPDFVRALLVPSWFFPTVEQSQASNVARLLFVNIGHSASARRRR